MGAIAFLGGPSLLLLFNPILLGQLSVPAPGALALDEGAQITSATGAAEFLVDPSQGLGAADLAALEPSRWSRTVPAGATGAVWIRLALAWHGPRPETLWLQISNPYAEAVEAHVTAPGGAERVYQAGQRVPFSARVIPARVPVFPVPVEPGQTSSVLARVRGASFLDAQLRVGPPAAFLGRFSRALALDAVVYGLMLIMGFYGLALAVLLRSRVQLTYAAYTLILAGWLAQMSGDLQLLLGGVPQTVSRFSVHVPILAAQLCAIVFCRDFLGTRANAPRADLWLRILFVAVAVDLVGGLFVPWGFTSGLITVLVPALYVTYAAVGLLRLRQGYRPARYYAVAWLAVFAVMVATVLALFDVLPSIVAEHGVHLALGVDVVFLSLALADRTLQDNQRIVRLNEASGRFVPFEFLSILGRTELPEVRHGDQVERELTVYFSDVRGFTTMVEGMSPADTIRFVNAYLAAMEPPITAQHGFIDKYIGDAIMALFESADDAVTAAVEGLRALERHNAERARAGDRPVSIGIGLHTGPLVLGTVGSERRINCTVLGDSVNLASRIEGLTKQYGAALLLSQSTRARLRDPARFALRRLDRVAAKGKTEPVTLYEVLDGLGAAERDRKLLTRADFEAGGALYQAAQMQGALERFEACARIDAEDLAVRLYLERCRHYLAQPPPPGWDGVVRMQTK